jgi:hypothetical protein
MTTSGEKLAKAVEEVFGSAIPPASSCSPAPAGSVSDPATLESIRSALNYLVYGAGRKRCPQPVYADAHYGLAMVEKAQREAPTTCSPFPVGQEKTMTNETTAAARRNTVEQLVGDLGICDEIEDATVTSERLAGPSGARRSRTVQPLVGNSGGQ